MPQATARRSRLIIGLMSGTSLDGIDAVLVRVSGSGRSTRFRIVSFLEHPFPHGVRSALLRNSVPETSRVDEIARLNMLLAAVYSDAVRALARKARVPLSHIALIGSHGQTIHHLPRPHRMFGRQIRATLQIGDPSAIATLTGITTVGDFRVADMAAGGEGAPLVPYVDWLLFRSRTRNRMLLNIGGIANITILPKGCAADHVVAFDTGPGNMVVDALMRELFNKPYDRGGRTALRGDIALDLMLAMSQHPYLARRPPKSTGREEFGEEFVGRVRRHARGYAREDIIASASFFTVFAIADAWRRFARNTPLDEVIVSGGGAHNRFFLKELSRLFPQASVRTIDGFGVTTDQKEALCFALLANECMAGRPANLPAVTGARKRAILGKICRPLL